MVVASSTDGAAWKQHQLTPAVANILASSGAIPIGSFDEDTGDSGANRDKQGGGSNNFPTSAAPNSDCPAPWGNSDIYGGTYPDPTP